MSVEQLSDLVRPPELPPFIETSGWAPVEADLGTPLPSDYKAFVERYGPGRLGGFISAFVPTTRFPNLDLVTQAKRQLAALRELRDGGEPCPYSLFPESDGLLPFAGTDNGDILHWLTAGTPEEWSVVVNDSRSPRYELHSCGMTSFLAGVLAGERRCAIFPRSFPGKPTFEPILASA